MVMLGCDKHHTYIFHKHNLYVYLHTYCEEFKQNIKLTSSISVYKQISRANFSGVKLPDSVEEWRESHYISKPVIAFIDSQIGSQKSIQRHF